MVNLKWLRFGIAVLPLWATNAWAVNPDTGPGCGLGKMLWEDYDHPKSILPQAMMATTNGTSGSQTFGISSGTSGCTNDGTVMAEYKVDVFAAANYDSLSQEMARGGGEHLASLAELMGVPEESRPEFYSLAQTQYASLVASGDTTPTAMIATLRSGMKVQPALTKVSTN